MKLSPFLQFTLCLTAWFLGFSLSSAAVIDALDERTEYEYNGDGQRTAQRDALGRETTYTYDDLGRRTGRTLPSKKGVRRNFSRESTFLWWRSLAFMIILDPR